MTEDLTREQYVAEAAEAERKRREAIAKLAEIDELALEKERNGILEKRHAEERKHRERLEASRRRQEEIREQRDKEAEAAAIERNKKVAEEARLQQIDAEREAKVREKKDHEERMRKIAEETHLIELEAQRKLNDLYRAKPTPTDDEGASTLGPRNEDLAFAEESKDASRDTQGRARLFNRSEAGIAPDYNASQSPSEQPQSVTQEWTLPEEFKVVNGCISEPVFKKLFGPEHPFALFISGQDGLLCAHGYRLSVNGVVSRRFTPNCQCVIERGPSGCYLTHHAFHAGSRERIDVSFASTDELFKPLPLTPSEIRIDVAVDDEELITSDQQ